MVMMVVIMSNRIFPTHANQLHTLLMLDPNGGVNAQLLIFRKHFQVWNFVRKTIHKVRVLSP